VSNDTYDIGDIIRAALGNALDALARADIVTEPAIVDQVRPPTDEELAAITATAESAAQLQDEIKTVMGDRGRQLSKLKAELKDRMLKHGLRELTVSGRPPIELNESNSRKPTRKAIIATFQDSELKKLTEEQRRDSKLKKKAEADGKMRGLNLWNAIETSTSYSVSIPDPVPTEMESPY